MKMVIFKKYLLLVVALTTVFLSSCREDEPGGQAQVDQGKIEFTYSLSSISSNRISSDSASFLLITIVDSQGAVVLDREEIELYYFGDEIISEPISLNVGSYQLTEFLVLNDDNEVIYATPKEESKLDYLISTPLPINFGIVKDNTEKIIPEVISANSIDPADFGYSSFSFEVVGTFDFQISVFTYDSVADNFQLTTAELFVKSNDDTLFYDNLADTTNSIKINDGYSSYQLIVEKDGYVSFEQEFTASELKSYDSSPLMVKLFTGYQSLANGLVAFYPFNGNGIDESANNNDGVVHNAVLTLDRKSDANSAYYFNGSDAYISVASDSTLNPDDQLSINLWIKVDSLENRYTPIIHKGGTYKTDFTNREYVVYIEDNGKIFSESSGDGLTHRYQAGLIPDLSQWFMFTTVIDRENHKMRLYINSELKSEINDDYSSFTNNNDSLKIASWDEANSSYAAFFNGTLDDIRIYNRALTVEEISLLYTE